MPKVTPTFQPYSASFSRNGFTTTPLTSNNNTSFNNTQNSNTSSNYNNSVNGGGGFKPNKLNSTLYSEGNRLELHNIIRFRCRIDDQDGKDVHRDFSGVYYPRWRALYLDEIRPILNNKDYKTFPIYPFDVYLNKQGEHFMTEDFVVGQTLQLGPTKCTRDKGAKRYVITSVDRSSLKTPTQCLRQYLQDRSIPSSVIEDVLAVRDAFIRQAGGAVELGIKDMGRRFRIMDNNGDRKVTRKEFWRSVKEAHVDMSEERMDAVFHAFDRNEDGSISYDELLAIIRGPMNERRKAAVALAFRKLDLDGDGIITLHEIAIRYNAERHPDVVRGELTPQQVLAGFMGVWDTRDKNGEVSFAEFCDYYNGVSASVDDDELFEAIIYSSWKIMQ